MVDTPGLVQCSEHISTNDIVADVAQVTKQLMVVGLTVGKAFFLVVPVAKEWLLTFGTDKVLYVPVLAKSCDHSLLNWPSASTTDWDAHLVMAAKAVQVPLYLTCLSSQFHTTRSAVEMVRVIGLTAELEWHVINDAVAFIADVFATRCSLLLCIAFMT